MFLFVRMIVYVAASFIGGYHFAVFDENSMTLTINLEQLTILLVSLLTVIITWVSGRFHKRRGGAT